MIQLPIAKRKDKIMDLTEILIEEAAESLVNGRASKYTMSLADDLYLESILCEY